MSVIEIGSLCFVLSFICALMQFFAGLYSLREPADGAMNYIRKVNFIQISSLILCFFALIYAFVTSDFSVMTVADNSHTDKPLLYKIVGVWGNHEGSMLLWVIVLGLYGLGLSNSSELRSHIGLYKKSLVIYGGLASLMIGFTLFTSNPFDRLFPIPDNGRGLNPLLQDIGLAIHPPLLYGGYVGFSAVFIVACASLWQGSFDKKIAMILRQWTLIAWCFLTAGIGMGMWWAYYELGWGGFWFWDPVENASFMPWLAGTALLHSLAMSEKRDIMKSWSVLLAIFAFGSSMLGTFIVRSGIITSVHSFASSPERGVFILGILLLSIGGALMLYALRSDSLRDEKEYDLISREGALLINNYLLCGILLIVLVGTLYPTFLQIIGSTQISVGAPYFNKTIAPLFYVLVILCPLAGFLSWHGVYNSYKKPIIYMGVFALGAVSTAFIFLTSLPIYARIFLLLGGWIIFGSLLEFIFRGGLKNISLLKQEAAKFGGHIAIGIFLIGLSGTVFLKNEKTLMMEENKIYKVGQDDFVLLENGAKKQENYIADYAKIRHIQEDYIYEPQRRYFPIAKQTTAEADIVLSPLKDVYITIGEETKTGKRQVNIRIHPLVGFLWGSMVFAVIFGFMGLFKIKRL